MTERGGREGGRDRREGGREGGRDREEREGGMERERALCSNNYMLIKCAS